MQNRLVLCGIAAILTVGTASAKDAASEPAPIKTPQQIRCELLDDCKPLPATRAWITRTGEAEPVKGKIVRSQKAAAVAVKPEAKTGRGSANKAALAIAPVKQSDLFINFAEGSWEINDAAFEQVTELFKALTPEEWGKYRFEIAGHTDALGTASENEILSKKRAEAVVNLLVARGVSNSQLVPKGYGYRRPIEGLDRLDGRNRRVEIIKIK